LIEDLLIRLARYPYIVIVMDVVVLDVYDTWGILLSRKWDETLGGTLHMDLSYATIPIGKEINSLLYNQPKKRTHVEDLETDSEVNTLTKEDHSKDLVDYPHGIDLDDLPQEEYILDVIWPKREDHHRQLDKYNDKELDSITIM